MNASLLKTIRISLALAAAAIFAGCQKQQDASQSSAPPPAKTGAITSAEKNSFDQVAAKLNPGGDFYLYISTEKMLTGLAAKIAAVSNTLSSLPTIPAQGRDGIARGFQLVDSIIKDSGIEQISGLGVSSIAREKDNYLNKTVLHHYPGKADGLIWSLFGKAAHPLAELDMLPESTAMAFYFDLDVPLLWQTLQNEAAQLHIPDVDKALAELPAQFQAKAGLSLDSLLSSLGGGYGLVVTINETKKLTLPIPGMQMEIPQPGLIIFWKAKSDAVFNRVDQLLAGNPMVLKSDQPDLKSRTMALPIPIPNLDVSPTLARSGDYLFLTSSDKLLQEVLAV